MIAYVANTHAIDLCFELKSSEVVKTLQNDLFCTVYTPVRGFCYIRNCCIYIPEVSIFGAEVYIWTEELET